MLSWYDVCIAARERQADHLREAAQNRMLARAGTRRSSSLWEKLKKRLATRASPPRKRRKVVSRPLHEEAHEVLVI